MLRGLQAALRRHLDWFLNRDSAEALLRYRYKLKDPAELRGMFTQHVRVRLPQDGSKYGGIYLDFMPPPAGESEPFVTMVPQLGCERVDSKGWEYLTEDDLRDQDERSLRDLKRAPRADPAFDVVEASLAAEPVQFR